MVQKRRSAKRVSLLEPDDGEHLIVKSAMIVTKHKAAMYTYDEN